MALLGEVITEPFDSHDTTAVRSSIVDRVKNVSTFLIDCNYDLNLLSVLLGGLWVIEYMGELVF